ncbi:MAG: hypothetical protein AB7N80_14120 [Bdellovibrionales bacterium]
MKMERRQLLKNSLWIGGLGLLAPVAKAGVCGVTPAQTAGPFYPGEAQFTAANDLTEIPGKATRAKGLIVHLHGQVVDGQCQPIEGANVEIWQACATGRYNNPRDPNPAELDPNFRYWGEAYTDAEGKYYFKTIKPGAYPASEGWDRPPHIHVKVSRLGYRDLVTQLYFADEPLNDKDFILQDTPAGQREQLIVDFKPAQSPHSEGVMGEFIITMQPVRR